jgi:hypothetical protein
MIKKLTFHLKKKAIKAIFFRKKLTILAFQNKILTV